MQAPGSKKIQLQDYEILQTLGRGAFGRVRLGRHKQSNEYMAIKILKKSEIIRLQQVDHITSEVKILQILDHPFMVNLIGTSQDDRYLYICMELVHGGELYTYKCSLGKIENQNARFYASQVVVMFEYLHAKNIIYRDLKPENVLIDTTGYLKLTDFGFAKYVEARTYTVCGTPEYIAPEILLNKGHGKPADWWTLGVFIYELVAGYCPFTDEDPMSIYQRILKGKVKFPKDFDKNGRSLVKHLLVHDLSKRYGNLKKGVNDIKNHRWFKDFDWIKLLSKKLVPPHIPQVRNMGDTSNFPTYADSPRIPPAVSASENPFKDW